MEWEYLDAEQAQRELTRMGNASEAWRITAPCMYQLVRVEDVEGGVLIAPKGEEDEDNRGPNRVNSAV